jgi:hypothetical protein
MSYAVGDRVVLLVSLSTRLLRGSEGDVTRVIVGGLYDVAFDAKPNGSPIAPVIEDTVSEANLAPAAASTVAAAARFAVGDRIALRITLSRALRKGSKGDVTRVIVGGVYDVSFDEKPNGDPIDPPDDEAVSEGNLEPA